MKRANKTIISCALTGSIHTPTMSPYLPITTVDMIREGKGAVDAGAAILHLHARNGETGAPSSDPEDFRPFVSVLSQETDAVINITTGGATTMTIEERLAAAMTLEPEVASLNMGSINFSIGPVADRYTEWKYDWEEAYVRGSHGRIFSNTFDQIEATTKMLGQERGIKFEFECYDVGHLYNLAYIVDKGLVEPPFFIQTIFGILGGIGADLDNLTYMVNTADKLFGDDYYLSAFGAGRHQIPFAMSSALRGGNVRVGLEDSLMIGRGELATSNSQQVAKVADALRSLGHELATPDEARTMLKLKGRDTLKI